MRFSALIYLVVLFACQKENKQYASQVIAHAGAGLEVSFNPFPDNSQDAITYAVNLGVKAIEVDLQLSLDNHFFLFHDDFLNGKTTHKGCIYDKTKSEMLSVRYAFHQNQGVDLLEQVDFHGIDELFLDVRHYNSCAGQNIDSARIVNAILGLKLKSTMKRVIVVSNFKSLLNAIKMHDKEVVCCLEVSDYNTLLNSLKQDDFEMYMIRNSKITVQQVRHVKLYDKKVIIFDIRSHQGNKNALEKNPDYIMTDAVQSALTLIKN